MTQLRCRLHDMAYVRPTLPEAEFMRGRLVEIIDGPVPAVAKFGPGWLVKGHLGVPLSVVLQAKNAQVDLRESVVGDEQRVYLPDAWLYPHRPGPIDGEESTDKPFKLEIAR